MQTSLPTTQKSEINIALPRGCRLGNYRVLDTLGQGGFGITYLAEYIPSGKRVVIKENMPAGFSYRQESTLTVAPTGSGEEQKLYNWALKRFLEEAQLLAELNHPNIVQVTEAFTALGTAYYVMEHIEGNVLHKAAPPPGKITEQWLRPVLCDILQALSYVHDCGLLHRDIKPNNILLDNNGRAVLIDFGTARSLLSERSATVLESPGYTPLEQLQTNGAKGPWIDIYALGATCYRLITGQNPPRSLDRLGDDTACLTLAEHPELLKRFTPAFLRGIDRALSLNYKKRWQTAAAWIEEINSAELPPIPTAPVYLPTRRTGGQKAAGRQIATLPPVPQKKGAGRGEWWFYVVACFMLMGTIEATNGRAFPALLLFIIYLVGAYRRLIRLQRSLTWLPLWLLISFTAGCMVMGLANSETLGGLVFCVFAFIIPGIIPDPQQGGRG